MVLRIRQSLKNINYRLYAALLVFGLVPTIYTSVRVFFLGQLPGEWAFFIAGQLSWVMQMVTKMNFLIVSEPV